MKKALLLGLVCVIVAVGANGATAADTAPKGPPQPVKMAKRVAELPEIVVYKNHGLNPDEGVWTINVGYSYIGDDWNDTISSFAVVRGTWDVCRGANFEDCRRVGPGTYDMHDWAGSDDTISSLRPI